MRSVVLPEPPSNERMLLSVTGRSCGRPTLQRTLEGTKLARSRTAKPLDRPSHVGGRSLGAEVVDIRVQEAGSEDLAQHAEIPIAFLVDRVLVPEPGGGPLDFVVKHQPEPWLKDYDTEEGGDPAHWPRRFDTSTWRVISAWSGGSRAGGLVLVADVSGLDMLEDRSDLALIWDLRVAPEFRGRGVGARLVASAVEWARSFGHRELKVETQNINVGACQFYKSQGFELRSAVRGAYRALPDELQMLWYRGVR